MNINKIRNVGNKLKFNIENWTKLKLNET